MSYIKSKEQSGGKKYKQVVELKKHIDKPLSAILSLNTVAHTIGAAGVGAQVTKVFGEAYFGIASAILTILILIVTEIIPKTIGARYWKSILLPVGRLIRVTIFIAYPLVILSSFVTRLISKKSGDQSISREQISALANLGVQEGIFQEKENKIIQNLIKLRQIRASDIMTPRVVVTLADEDMHLAGFLKNKDYLNFSRIPVFSEHAENITGYVIRQTVFENLAENKKDLKLKDIKRKIVIIPYLTSILNVWETLLQKKEHIALVIDEYGGMDGIVTMEDIIETLLGFEIIDEKDQVKDMQQYARERWNRRQAKYRLLADRE